MPVAPAEARSALAEVDALLGRHSGSAGLTELSRFLRSRFAHYAWVGVYRLDGQTLLLDGWDGERATEHVRIPIDQGLCGRAAREGRTIRVGDVSASPEYLSCFLDTRSELVAPVHDGARVLGEIDVDGAALNAYDESDERFLEEVARRTIPALRASAASAASARA
ncbi:MAG TPA: GAF domain-containing protein [Thermoplasmata archaeon]|nr:GAF domain-containing protein [Thermoplasmata archaeon]